uniref:Uncharacterized protein n=1 Tax=Cuerna arida TaxID=1464854 RepID=A0A1B6FY56_9HEMI
MKTRTRTQVRQRYNFIKHMMTTKPGWTVVNAKRKGLNNTNKIRNLTQKNVERVKKEIDKVDTFFNLSQLEKDTFRIEKLKELRDQILLKRFDLKRRQKIFSDSSQINNFLLEYFKNSQRKPPIRPSKIDHHACNVYMNEMLLMAKYFGHDLKFPETENEVKNNLNLSKKLQHCLCAKLKTADNGMKNLDESNASTSIINNCDSSIDYKPENEDDIIMHDSWHTPLFDVTRLNFSEMFKRTVFDYSNGMHKDIWYSRNNRSSPHWSTFPGVVAEFEQSSTQQPFHLPPNHLTTLGLRSLLLSRYRLRQDASTKESTENSKEIENEETTTKFKIDVDLNNRLLDQFQETMITLFTWPKVLSVTSIGSTQVTQVSTARATQIGGESNQSINISCLMNNMTPEPTDVIFEASKESVRKRKVRQTMQEQSEGLKRKLVEIRRGITCKNKVNIDQLLKKVKESQVKTKKKMRNDLIVSVHRKNKTLTDTKSSTSLYHTKQKQLYKVPNNQVSSQLNKKTQVNINLNEDNSKLPLYKQDQCISIRDRNKTAITYRGARKDKTEKVLSHEQLHEVTEQNNPLKNMEIASTGVPQSYSGEIHETENLDRNIPINQPHSDEVESCLEIVHEECVAVSDTASECTGEKGSCEATMALTQSSKTAKKPVKIKSGKHNEAVPKVVAKGICEQSGSKLPTNVSDLCKGKSRLGTVAQEFAPVPEKTKTNRKRKRSSSKEVAVKSLKQLRKQNETLKDDVEPIGKKPRCPPT